MKPVRCMGLLALCVLGAAPAATAAESEPSGLPERVSAFFVRGSDGYKVEALGLGNQVLLEAKRKNVSALYAVRGKVTPERIDARFGRLGRLAVRFHPLGGRARGSSRCRPPLEIGFFRGTIEFEGEGGYTSVDAERAVGIVLDLRPDRCPRRSRAGASASGGSGLDTHITAISKRGETVTSVELSRKRGRSWLRLQAVLQERRGKMRILRQASTVVGGENAFLSSAPGVRPPFAFVAAPKPFTGSAVLDGGAAPEARWAGDLTAWLPGAGKVGLTGPDYALAFCRRGGEEPGCKPEQQPVLSPLAMLQGSGSQSQLLAEARLSWSRYLRNSASSTGSTP